MLPGDRVKGDRVTLCKHIVRSAKGHVVVVRSFRRNAAVVYDRKNPILVLRGGRGLLLAAAAVRRRLPDQQPEPSQAYLHRPLRILPRGWRHHKSSTSIAHLRHLPQREPHCTHALAMHAV